jgi:uncharacterized protein (DUF111 family)
MRTLYLESVAGIAGDMFTAAFVDAGLVDSADLRAVPELLGWDDVRVEITTTERAGAQATHIQVIAPEGAQGGRGTEGGHLVADGSSRSGGRPLGSHDPQSAGPAHQGEHAPGQGVSVHGEGSGEHRGQRGRRSSHRHYHYPVLVERIENSGLHPDATEFALRVFRLLAEAEGEAHGVLPEQVFFHEIGAVDSLVDVAMAGVCVQSLAPDRVLASPVKLGRGNILIEHGTHPVPPPASIRLAQGMPVASVPDAITLSDVELSTPTGLAILRALEPTFVEGFPEGTLMAQGSGSGTLDLEEYPNVFRLALLEQTHLREADEVSALLAMGDLPYLTDRVMEIRCNVDDQTGERTAWVVERALVLGALDAWTEPIVGKKGRPAACIVLLAALEEAGRLADFLLRHSSGFGLRYSVWDRLKLVREMEVRDTSEGPISFKVGKTRDGEWVKEKPEFEDLKKIWEEDPDFQP